MTSVSAVILRNMPFNLLKEMRTKVSLQLVKVSVAHALISFFFLISGFTRQKYFKYGIT